MTVLEALEQMVARGASDLHLTVGSPPAFRIHGRLLIAYDQQPLRGEELHQEIEQLLTAPQRETFLRERELDFAVEVPGLGRFRGNVSLERHNVCLTVRRIVSLQLDLDHLGLPMVCRDLATRPRGLTIVTGPTGSGKSTTMAAMVGYINANADRRIVTLEDPLEYVFRNGRSMVTQRQVGEDTFSFAAGLKHALRQNPDVIMVGEMRDPETAATVLTASETGHLVLTTAHAPSAPETIDRIIDMFPPNQQNQIRAQLAAVLQGVLYQQLVPRADGTGLVIAVEVMLGTHAVRSLIRENKTHQLYSAMELGSNQGMQTLDQALLQLVRKKVITEQTALAFAQKPASDGRDLAEERFGSWSFPSTVRTT